MVNFGAKKNDIRPIITTKQSSLPGLETTDLAPLVVRDSSKPPLIARESQNIAVMDKQATMTFTFITRFRHSQSTPSPVEDVPTSVIIMQRQSLFSLSMKTGCELYKTKDNIIVV